MKKMQQQPGESREAYLAKARRYARKRFNELVSTDEFRHCHESHPACKALRDAEAKYSDLESFGTEGVANDDIEFSYLNMGETYEPTLIFFQGKFLVGSWGDFVEWHERTHQ